MLLVTHLTYFPRIFPSSQLFLSYFLLISQLFLENFPFPNYFWSISQSFLTSQLLLDYFPVNSQLFPSYSSSCEEPMCLSWFAQQFVLNEANERIRDYFQTSSCNFILSTVVSILWSISCSCIIYNNYSMCSFCMHCCCF